MVFWTYHRPNIRRTNIHDWQMQLALRIRPWSRRGLGRHNKRRWRRRQAPRLSNNNWYCLNVNDDPKRDFTVALVFVPTSHMQRIWAPTTNGSPRPPREREKTGICIPGELLNSPPWILHLDSERWTRTSTIANQLDQLPGFNNQCICYWL